MANSGRTDYYINIVSGTIQRQDNQVLAAGLVAAGFMGPITWQQAQHAKRLGVNAREKYVSNLVTTGMQHQVTTGIGHATGLTGVAAIGDFFSRLGEANTWVRVGEVILGLILLSVGFARLTNSVPAATKIARSVGAVSLA